MPYTRTLAALLASAEAHDLEVTAVWRGYAVRVDRIAPDAQVQVSPLDPDAGWDVGWSDQEELEW